MNLNQFAQEVHQNAVDHGFWEEERTIEESIALIHSEWSEAFEEYRANRPMHYYNLDFITCDSCPNHPFIMDETCENDQCECGRKPEGIAVELIDGCIRILDLACNSDFDLTNMNFNRHLEYYCDYIPDIPLPRLIADAHWHTSEALTSFLGLRAKKEPKECFKRLIDLVFFVCAWIKNQGLDPIKLLREKHEYNKTRPYKHGKRC